jgi:hypothetical protein
MSRAETQRRRERQKQINVSRKEKNKRYDLAQGRRGAGKGKSKRICLTQSRNARKEKGKRHCLTQRRRATGERPKDLSHRRPGRGIAWMPGEPSVKMSELTFPERRPCRPNAVHCPLDRVPVDPGIKERQPGKKLTGVSHAEMQRKTSKDKRMYLTQRHRANGD